MILFVSDLHLSAQAPGVTRLFLDFLAGRARAAAELYVLGDLFEAWPGDDCIDDPDDRYNAGIVAALRELSDAGVALSVMRGNRDFLLGDDFATRSGARLLPDPYVLSLPAWQFVLAHGDALCTDDREYQTFRLQVRDPAWRAAFLAKPLAERKAIAAALRQQSENSKRDKAQYQMDLNAGATEDFLREHGYATFIHGHTHRPATHDHIVDGIHVERWVLADWHDDRGECLCWNGETLTREALKG
ncbi:MAG: UDP-2,3-diacylglucosamine diphosphatase [Candidatus Accumulibacter sp. 66-26]|nr:UDP-2,3-diacylglucosamine diphosphatase [Accumulibacter sp.]OJW48556.1 MAG: UDP-2,3-diacylglucosamine diphosphatase [Candidatus Accumulibacter sp. 66-26]